METKRKNVANVPNLRFPGFEGEWNTQSLGEITSWASGGTPAKDNSSYWNGDIPWISASSMRGISYSDSELKITEAGLKKGSRLAAKGNLLILVRGSMLFNKIPIGIALRNVAFNQDVKSIVVSNESSSDFVLNWFTAFESKLLNMVTGTGIGAGKLDLQELKDLKIKLPSLLEQQKISSFFSLLNQRIETQSKIIEELKLLQNTTVNHVFTQKLKFKNSSYKDYPEWQTESLGGIGKTYNGLTGKTKDDFGIGKPYIQYKQIFDQSKIDITRCELVKIKHNESQHLVKKGDIFFTVSSETPEEIGMSSVLLDEVEELYLNSFCFGYRPNAVETLLPSFARYLFRSDVIRNEIIKLAQGSTRYNMSKVALMKLKVILPTKEEQLKIGIFLTTLDDKMSVEENLLEKLKRQKQYLLSNLFI